ncbi:MULTISPECIES: dihydrolipoyl dehydrogenase family protein [unclassified Curtobacterium]|uniref:dihydrolipoyl dehydrogenase family protein n=1 Tax=unclassified Curtobacterium TaxID=257496 RepID=UPI000BD0EADF|nr:MULTISPECIES: NAD(P)/FAD-dependent oxidoreductase [unclassified Curtobacterium]MBF4589496.1 NAD(P)/FAD-dependent oxidoreductase [Curtobacterium sp. VKM Ac-1395]PCN49618.1 pyridine nucleotide-disulfide oxidoreductase [Curtobacterium sp. 'Ferrero']
MSDVFDLLVIGAGMAGTSAANKCAAQGWRVGIVDALPYGGTCALRGCDPKKILRRGAEVIDAARLMNGTGIQENGLSVDWAALMQRKRGFTDGVPKGVEDELTGNGATTFHGHAEFTGPNTLSIDGTTHQAERFLIASGATPKPLTFPGAEHLIDSTQFLDLEELPKRIVFIGGGFISFEFAHIAARAGAQCTIVDHGPRPLREFDPDLVGLLVSRSEQAGIRILRGTRVSTVDATSTGLQIGVDSDGIAKRIDADLVVHGAGRLPNVESLRLDAAGIASGPRGVTVAGHLQSTTNTAVYAAGDAADTAGRPLTPVAVFEGKVAASNMLKGTTTAPDYIGVPTTIFTIPELNRVGLLEEEAAPSHDIAIRFTDTSGWYSTYRVAETTAAAKVIIDIRTDQILGAHLLGPGYSELINTFGLAIKLGLTTRQLRSATATYPSLGSDLGSLL